VVASVSAGGLDDLLARIRDCRRCIDQPDGAPLGHEPRPVLRASPGARICICGQAPGTLVHGSGRPFTDPSGVRLRDWMGVSEDEFYDQSRIAIIPMGFCFPGHDAKGGDLAPRKECAPLWRAPLFQALTKLELVLLVGQYAQRWHLGCDRERSMTATVANWRAYLETEDGPAQLPLPHPSWRNNAWLKRNSWFERDVLPRLKREVRRLLG